MVKRNLAKVETAGSSPVVRSINPLWYVGLRIRCFQRLHNTPLLASRFIYRRKSFSHLGNCRSPLLPTLKRYC